MKKQFPHTLVIVFLLLVCCALLTWLLPGGQYVDGVFEEVDAQPQSWQIMTSLFNGFTRQAGIIVFILVVGASFWVVNSCKAIDYGVQSFLRFSKRLERHGAIRRVGVGNMVIAAVMLIFSLFGAVFGMSEETIAFTALFIPLAISMGYDSITGVCMVYVAAHVGFAGAFLNPFTIGIAQDLSGLPIFSGIGYRFICWLVLTLLTIVVVLLYAAHIKRHPHQSPVYACDTFWRGEAGAARDAAHEEAVPDAVADVAVDATLLATAAAKGLCAVEEPDSPAASEPVMPASKGRGVWLSYVLLLAVLVGFSVYSPVTTITVGPRTLRIVGLLPVLTALFAGAGAWAARGGGRPTAGRQSAGRQSAGRQSACRQSACRPKTRVAASPQKYILVLLLFAIVFLIVGVLGYGWYLAEISGLFLTLGIASGIAGGYGPNRIVKELTDGAKDILGAALVVALAAGLVVVLQEGRIMDRILFAMAGHMHTMGRAGSLEIMYGIQTVINVLIPSASAKAAITMPIMAPFSDLVGVSRQATVLAFQFGDGFTNMITPTSGVLMAVLGMARIPYAKWVKWVWPFIVGLIVLGALLLLGTLWVW